MTATSKYTLPFLLLPLLLLAGAALVVSAQGDIEYPIAELGGCANKEECKVYCDDSAHINECLAFAELHNLLVPREIEYGRAFAASLEGGNTPGGCTGKAECETYCTNVSNINECLAFAEAHGFLDEDEIREARIIADYINSGGQLPGGCASEASCKTYCENISHMEECLAFGEATGLMPVEEIEEARRVLPFILSGEMPGGCQTKDECEAYCDDSSHFEECVSFGVRAGFMTPEEAEMARKTGGKGPGDCRGEEECEVYCNDSSHQDECFAFALEHGFISEEELTQIKEGVGQIKQGLSDAPPEVISCLTDALGADVIADMQSGEFVPSREAGDVMHMCFETFGPGTEEVVESLNQASPEALSCIESKLGADRVASIRAGDRAALGQDLQEVFEECFGQFGGSFEGGRDDGEFGGIETAFENARPEVLGCLSGRIGYDAYVKIREGDYSEVTPETGEAFRYCYEQFGQQIPESFDEEEFHEEDFIPEEFDNGGFEEEFHPEAYVPSFDGETERCLAEVFGGDFKERMARGELRYEDMEGAVRDCKTKLFEREFPAGDFEIYDGSPVEIDTHVITPPEGYEIPFTEPVSPPADQIFPEYDTTIPDEFPSFEGLEGALNRGALLANPLLLFYYLFLPR